MATAVPNYLLFYMIEYFKDQTAFFSCADKSGISELAMGLYHYGFTLYSAGGTAKTIAEPGTPVIDIATLPGSVGAMLNHRLLTLQPCVHGPLLTSGSESDTWELRQHGCPDSFELIFVDFYPWEKTMKDLKDGNITFEQAWEKIDVGGPSMIKSAFKGNKFPVVTLERRNNFLKWLDAGCPDFEKEHSTAMMEAIQCVASREAAHADFYYRHKFACS